MAYCLNRPYPETNSKFINVLIGCKDKTEPDTQIKNALTKANDCYDQLRIIMTDQDIAFESDYAVTHNWDTNLSRDARKLRNTTFERTQLSPDAEFRKLLYI